MPISRDRETAAQSRHAGATDATGATDGSTGESAGPADHRSSDLRVRVGGVVALVVGLALAWWQIRLPFRGADPGPLSHWRLGGILLGSAIFLPVAGLACIIFGWRAIESFGSFPRDKENLSGRDIAIALAFIVPFMAVFFWVLIVRN